MDAAKFIKERSRMCNSYEDCDDCPLGEAECVITDTTPDDDCKRIIDAVDKWSKEHPRKTRQSVFLEHWPEAELVNGCLAICPKRISANYRNGNADCTNRSCADCLYKFWMQEVE